MRGPKRATGAAARERGGLLIVARTRRTDWINQGFAILREGGEAALTVDRLCRALGCTKGAFYHHFADAAAYAAALLAAWESINTSAPIGRAEAAVQPKSKRRVLDAAVASLDLPLDLAVRAWGLRDRQVRAFVARVDKRRVAYLTTLYPTRVSVGTRRKLARLEYAAFLGTQQLYPNMAAKEAREIERTLSLALRRLQSSSR